METPKTLLAAVRYFSDPQVCEDYMREIRWAGNPPVCHYCGGMRIGEVKTRNLMRCKDCRRQFSSKIGTIFEDSPLGLDKWFLCLYAVWVCGKIATCKELAELLKVTQSTAWKMRLKLKTALEIE
jgi:transposase-like protein